MELLVAVLLWLGPQILAVSDDARRIRLDTLQQEMKRLRSEVGALELRERSLLGDVGRMDAEIALLGVELEDIALRLDATEERWVEGQRTLDAIVAERDRRAPQLAARLREMYKRGGRALLPRVIVPTQDAGGLDGFRYAAFLSRRDAGQLAAWRLVTTRLEEERAALSRERIRLTELQREAARKEAALAAGRASRASLLTRVREDRRHHELAFGELESAARSLGRLVESMEEGAVRPALDVRKFRGLLDWPSEGVVSARFGTVVHPRFKTEVPHPGLDISAKEGAPFRAVFDGRVAFAAALAGYGLTCIVDHGNGVVSVYAHAAVLLTTVGESVARGQQLGKVGESGSLKGPYLYFEMREAGKPVDPASWLRAR